MPRNANRAAVRFEKLAAKSVEGGDERKPPAMQEIEQTGAHLARSFVGEGNGENLLRGHPAFDEVVDARGQNAGLARTGTSKNRNRSGRRQNCGLLPLIETFKVVYFFKYTSFSLVPRFMKTS